MRTIELSVTTLSHYNLTLNEGKSVLRNQTRINGLIGVRYSSIPAQYHGLLAKASFSGNSVNESILWTTDVFENTPSKLSDLSGVEYEKYTAILNDALSFYAKAFSSAEESVKRLLYASVTYCSESTVYCADERVVITEWGMFPKANHSLVGMPMYIDVSPDGLKTQDNVDNLIPDVSDTINNGENDDTETVSGNDVPISDDSGNNDSIYTNGTSTRNDDDDNSEIIDDKKRKWLYWLVPLLLLLILLLCLFVSPWSNGKTVIDVTPEIDSTDVVLSKDSLRYVVNNRLLLLITNENTTIDDFTRQFRKKYRDSERYVLSNPDTLINRITLTFPSQEMEYLEENLPNEFQDFGLIIIPETMYRNSYKSNDPGFKDSDKSWYFNECSVFDAWDVTMGDDDIIVAVIDDGFDLNHPELKGKVVSSFNAVYHTNNITASESGHGTHVAATAVGCSENNSGTSGIAPNCKLMAIQVGDSQGNMTQSAVMDAVIYAINNGADVVNMSLGMSFGPFVQCTPQYIQKNIRANSFLQEERVWNHIFNIANKQNVTFVIAGGNENCIVGLDPMQRSPNTIKVSAVQRNHSKADFSNYGDMSTVSAPGVGIYNAFPNNAYAYMDGTSMAAPIVAGGCALLKSKDPHLTTSELSQILKQTGRQSKSDVGPIVNFAKALGVEYNNIDKCDDINKRYNELLSELEQLKRQYSDCIKQPDTLSIPEGLSIEQLKGRWKSTTSLYNMEEEEVVIYFTFNGTSTAQLDIVEPSGINYTASLSVSISNDKVYIDQTEYAKNTSSNVEYNPYQFVLKPDKNRKAEGTAKNKVETINTFNFNLIKI